MINLGLIVMPQSAYKRELLRRLWELRMEVITAVENYKNGENDGNE
jgi:hypothetical protein